MKFFRAILFSPLLAFSLLFAQQAGVAHALCHALEKLTQQQDDKQAPTPDTCAKCADYVKLGSALKVGAYNFTPLALYGETIQHCTIAFRSIHIFTAVARGPPQPKRIA